MATKLKKMKLTSVDLVRAGANQEADICLFKSVDPQEAAESPTERERNIFKRFLDWLRENPAESDVEPDDDIEKADEDLEYIYKSAITESLQSIVADESLSAEEKDEMIAKSIDQYHERLAELFIAAGSFEGEPDGQSYIPEDMEKSDCYDEIEYIDP